jgi:hypothetical protein
MDALIPSPLKCYFGTSATPPQFSIFYLRYLPPKPRRGLLPGKAIQRDVYVRNCARVHRQQLHLRDHAGEQLGGRLESEADERRVLP